MKTFLLPLLGILLFGACNGNSNGRNPHDSERVYLDSFTSLSVEGPVKVNYIQVEGRSYAEVYNPNNMEQLAAPRVEGGCLRIVNELQSRKYPEHKLPVVSVYGPALRSLAGDRFAILKVSDMRAGDSVSVRLGNDSEIALRDIDAQGRIVLYNTGNGDIDLKMINCETLSAELQGSGDIDIENVGCKTMELLLTGTGDIEAKGFSCKHVQAALPGTGDIELKGHCTTADLNVSSTGDLDAKNLEAEEVTATTSGKGDLRCNAARLLRTNTEPQSIVEYRGNPQIEATGRRPRRLR